MSKLPLDNIGAQIDAILRAYIKVASYTHSAGEREVERFFCGQCAAQPYFAAHPELYGTYPISGDPLGRSVCYAMYKGRSPRTVVLLHHYDIVNIEDFKLLAPYAFEPELLHEQLRQIAATLPAEAHDDLLDGGWLFGRGCCDMKGGGAIQLALLARYAAADTLDGNIIVLAVPDEENLSAGMRAAIGLLDRLREQYQLEYRLMINSEPHQRKHAEQGLLSLGSVGKLMPFVYVRGSLAHAGKVFEGLNPLNLLAEAARRTELNMQLADIVGDEAAPPPTWLYLRDNKSDYDVSMPLSAYGCISVQTLRQTPGQLLSRLRPLLEQSFAAVLAQMNDEYRRYAEARRQPAQPLPWRVKVSDYRQLYAEAEAAHGDAFRAGYRERLLQLAGQLQQNDLDLIAANLRLLEYVYGYIDDLNPRIVYGLLPPYYPSAGNVLLDDLPARAARLPEHLLGFCRARFGQSYQCENFYTGISDLSYSSLQNSAALRRELSETMPLFGLLYDIPLEQIERNSMPCVNIGPWGKDFHKLTERVYKQDLYQRTPELLAEAIEFILER
ncbi:MAG: M20/M25/M40 family metallo-hydrolase [Bacillota bacterium]|nr:M20/M25/M40 family metallo-hydrolase [Bacillota bacterium]